MAGRLEWSVHCPVCGRDYSDARYGRTDGGTMCAAQPPAAEDVVAVAVDDLLSMVAMAVVVDFWTKVYLLG